MNRFEIADIAKTFGTDTSDLLSRYDNKIHDLNYRTLNSSEEKAAILGVLKKIESGTLEPTGDKERWERGWSENLSSFKNTNELESLIPKYIRPNQPVRLFGDFIMPEVASFEYVWYNIFRDWLFRKYFEDFDHVYEFGCGSGFNLAILAKMYPDKTFYGMDWTQSSVEIANKLGEKYDGRISGRSFDFFNPDYSFKIKENSAVFTIGALEQTGQRYDLFFEYLLRMKPKLVVNIEPVCEWYDENNLVDYLGVLFIKKRNYWQNASEKLLRLNKDKKIEIQKMHRTHLGSLYIEGYSQMIWKPV